MALETVTELIGAYCTSKVKQEFRVYCALRGKPMAAVLREMIESAIESDRIGERSAIYNER